MIFLLILTAVFASATYSAHRLFGTRGKIARSNELATASSGTIWLEITKAILVLGLSATAFFWVEGVLQNPTTPGEAWRIPVATADPVETARRNFGIAKLEFLTFRACWNDDACEPTAPGIQQDVECYWRRYPMLVESDGHDVIGGQYIENPDNIRPETSEAAWDFATKYNTELVRLIQQRDGPCIRK